MRCDAAHPGKERGLSEVIGFVLLLGVITAAFSLYLVYGVPAQGRENEISHMNDVKDQFVAYKIGVDSLWTNQQTNLAMTSSFPLGTGGQTTQGSNSIIPILQPVASGGILAINQRTSAPEYLTILSISNVSNTIAPSITTTVITSAVTLPFTTAPSVLLVNLSTPNSSWNSPQGIIQISGTKWNASVSVTPNMAECLIPGSGSNVTYSPYPTCRGSDITVSVIKNGVPTLTRAAIYTDINSSTVYSVNLLDPAYGLQSFITYPEKMTFFYNGTLSLSTVASQNAYPEQPYNYTVPLGSLTYTARNNYWIPQTYYYQMGGVFLSQIDGITYKLPPEITFQNNGNNNITVNIVAIAYDPANSGIVGGNGPAQVSTTLKSGSGTLPYATISPNTRMVNISLSTPDSNAAAMWANYLNTSANVTGGIPRSYYSLGNTTTGSYILFNSNWSADGNPHVTLNVKTENLSVSLRSVGGTLQ